MYCPKCSQLQSSEEMRFCSRCGFALAGVALVVQNEGVIPQLPAASGNSLPLSRKRVMLESVLFAAFAWAVTLGATTFFNSGGFFENVAKIAALIFFFLGMIGLLRFLYGFLFMKDRAVQPEVDVLPGMSPRVGLVDPPERGALSAPRGVPATDYTRRRNTKEITPQPSVTENTTRLLEDHPTK